MLNVIVCAFLFVLAQAEPTRETEAKPPTTAHLVSNIDVKDFGAETVRIGDLDGDGGPDLLFVQSVSGTRAITCLTASTIFGKVLWQTGVPSKDNGAIYSDLPVQIYDWDRDGHNEVLYVRQAVYAEPPYQGGVRERADRYEGNATMLVLDGRTGQEKTSFALPAPADDCFLFADLTGRGRREDLVVKDRYWNMWGVSHQGEALWHWEGATGHFPAIADVDEDGKDEVFVGYALIDDGGKVLFQHDAKGSHQDAAYIVRAPDAKYRLLFGNGGIHCLNPDGAERWAHPLREAQHVVAGRFRPSSPLDFVVIDRTPLPTHHRDEHAWAILYLYDFDGNEIWQRQQPEGAWAIATIPVNWFGPGTPLGILVYGHGLGRPAAIYNGEGEIVDTLPLEPAASWAGQEPAGYYALAADVWGDSRDEVILFGSRGACIYANTRPIEIPTLYNENLYPGM